MSSFSNSKGSPQAGFSLLELAIVLVILGVIGGLSLPLLTAQMSRTAILKTRAHQDYVLNAIASYVEKKGRFPCPAQPHLTGPPYGLAQDSCRGKKAKGIIPFKTLGISEIYSKDGFKRLMTYVVEPQLTQKLISLQDEPGGFITVMTEDGGSVISDPLPDEENPNYVALVLLSHGESGGGAFMGKGQSNKIQKEGVSPHKKENFDDNFVFIESSQTDDILRWESRDQFLKQYVHLR